MCVSGSLAKSVAVVQHKYILEKNTFYLQLVQIAGYADVKTNGVLLPSAGCIWDMNIINNSGIVLSFHRWLIKAYGGHEVQKQQRESVIWEQMTNVLHEYEIRNQNKCDGTFCFHKIDAFSDEFEAEVI